MRVESTLGEYTGVHDEAAVREKAEAMALGRYTRSFGLSLAITCVLSAVLVVIKELDEHLMNWMKAATTHHWITHGVIDVAAFVLIGLALSRLSGGEGVQISSKNLAATVVSSVIAGSIIIAGFYLIHG